jgi:adenylylsulfate kinase-like enzyme
MTGINSPYEAPAAADITVASYGTPVEENVRLIAATIFDSERT